MAKSSKQGQSSVAGNADLEDRLVAFAEQLGTWVGTAQRRTEEFVESESVQAELTQLKEQASSLLDYVNSIVTTTTEKATTARKAAMKKTAKPAKASAAKAKKAAPPATKTRGLVDAPGKRHRQPPPQERGSKHMSMPKGSQTATAKAKTLPRGSR